jgi:uncharacterized protein (TIGR02646 family)
MIRVERGDEAGCPELAAAREREVSRVSTELERGAKISEELLGKRYQSARPILYRAQYCKCCYCEAKTSSERWHHVEHFRPKLRYWWLTWSWENLLFACHDCNNAKSDDFPLAEGSTPLRAHEQPPGDELPSLIDPAADDPRIHIRFVPIELHGRWFPVDRTPRGKQMLRTLGWVDAEAMLQTGLVERWQDHVDSLRDLLIELRRAFASEDGGRIREAWQETRRRRRASQPFVALTLDVLEWHFSAEIERWQLPLDVIYD